MTKTQINRFNNLNKKHAGAFLLLISAIAFSVAYALIHTQVGFSILTTPPPDIPGPYYIAAELTIYGPPVNLATIKSRMGGAYAPDYSYVKWGSNPFYKVYADNTLQEVYYGPMIDVLDRLSHNFQIENDLISTYYSLKNNGAIDPESQAGQILYFGNMPGTIIAINQLSQTPCSISTITSYWHATEGVANTPSFGVSTDWQVLLNNTLCIRVSGGNRPRSINATGCKSNNAIWSITRSGDAYSFSGAFYFKDLQYFDTNMPSSNYKLYTVTDSPGTGYVTKSLTPASPKAGSTFNVTVMIDTPSANNANITDYYPNTFTWSGAQVTLKKFKVNVGQVASATVSVTPTPEFDKMKFTINYEQATAVLQSIAGDEYITMEYTLIAPTTAGEYTLPAARIEYSIPLP